MIGTTVSHYTILEKLGEGGMGVVYRAEDFKLKRTVALKFLPPDLTRDEEAKQRFIHEAQAASALQHNNICAVHDIDETADHQMFIVMDCYEGQSLKDKIGSGKVEIEEAIEIAAQVGRGLAKAHEHGIVHRDIKPANIIVDGQSTARILDFGLAKLSGQTMLTKTGTTLGTAAYMSPEQARGDQVDHRTDIWSLGVVLYEMLAGQRPFASEYEQALTYAILNEDPKPLRQLSPELPEAIEKICLRAMAKDPKDRYQKATELVADLEAYRSGSDLSQKTRRVLTKRRKVIYAVSAAVVVIAGAIGLATSLASGESFDRVAVLPFENLSKDATGELFSDAIPEGITDGLHRVASLKVPMFKTSKKFKGRSDYAEIARQLGAKALVEGSVTYVNNRVRVIVRLIDPKENRELWSAPFDGTGEDILDIQSSIAQAVVRQVRATVAKDEEARLTRPEKKVDPQAYELYLSARQESRSLQHRTTRGRWDSLMATFQKAIDIEHDNALYYAELANGYGRAMSLSLVPSHEILPKMKAAARKAMELDPDLVESNLASSFVDTYEYNHTSALERSKRALEINPGSFDANRDYAICLRSLGRFSEAIAILRRLEDIDSATFKPNGYMTIGQTYFFSRRYDEAMEYFKAYLRQFPGSEYGHTMMALAYSMKGMHAEAIAHNDSGPYFGTINGPFILIRAGKRDLAIQEFKRNYAKIDPYGRGAIFAVLGQKDSAFYWFEQSYKEPTGSMGWFPYDPFIDTIRSDPRYEKILRAMNVSGVVKK